jgi:hypothetical protein
MVLDSLRGKAVHRTPEPTNRHRDRRPLWTHHRRCAARRTLLLAPGGDHRTDATGRAPISPHQGAAQHEEQSGGSLRTDEIPEDFA